MRTNVVQFLAVVASVFIVLSLLKMLSDNTSPVVNSGSVRSNFTDAPEENEQPSGYPDGGDFAAVDRSSESDSLGASVAAVAEDQEGSTAGSDEAASNCFPKDSLTAKDLLPSDEAIDSASIFSSN